MTSRPPMKAELFCDDPVTDVSEEAVESAAARQAETIRTALDQPVLEAWSQDLAMGPTITVLGVGGAGCNALGSLVRSGFDAATMVAFNTDVQDLHLCPVSERVVLGSELCRGGAGQAVNLRWAHLRRRSHGLRSSERSQASTSPLWSLAQVGAPAQAQARDLPHRTGARAVSPSLS